MNGDDINKWNIVLNKLNKNKLNYNLRGDKIEITMENKCSLGYFHSVNDIYLYLCGYEAGLTKKSYYEYN
jgi:hypothetical protein